MAIRKVASESSETSASDIAKLVRDQLEREEVVKASLESRAAGVISSAGTLVTLLLALATLVTKPSGYQLPLSARVFVGGALGAFLLSAFLAIMAIRPMKYGAVGVKSLRELTEDYAWNAPIAVGGPRIAGALIGVIEQARRGNAVKGRFLLAAVTAEVLAIVIVAAAVGIILTTG